MELLAASPLHPGCPQRLPHKPMPPLQPSLVLRAEFGVHGHTQLKEGLGGQVWRPLAWVVSRVPARLTLQGRVTWVWLQSGHTWPHLGHAGAGPPSRASAVTPMPGTSRTETSPAASAQLPVGPVYPQPALHPGPASVLYTNTEDSVLETRGLVLSFQKQCFFFS